MGRARLGQLLADELVDAGQERVPGRRWYRGARCHGVASPVAPGLPGRDGHGVRKVDPINYAAGSVPRSVALADTLTSPFLGYSEMTGASWGKR